MAVCSVSPQLRTESRFLFRGAHLADPDVNKRVEIVFFESEKWEDKRI
jgi:hypothetical protein